MLHLIFKIGFRLWGDHFRHFVGPINQEQLLLEIVKNCYRMQKKGLLARFTNQSLSNKPLEIVLNDCGMWTFKFGSWGTKFKFAWSYCRLDWAQHIKERQDKDHGNVAWNWNWISYLVLQDIKIIFLIVFRGHNKMQKHFQISLLYYT